MQALSGSSVTLPVMTSTVEYYAEAGQAPIFVDDFGLAVHTIVDSAQFLTHQCCRAKEETGSSITGKSNPVADLQILTFGEHISTVSKSFFMKCALMLPVHVPEGTWPVAACRWAGFFCPEKGFFPCI